MRLQVRRLRHSFLKIGFSASVSSLDAIMRQVQVELRRFSLDAKPATIPTPIKYGRSHSITHISFAEAY